MIELKPCPFCGEEPRFEIGEIVSHHVMRVANYVCRNCGASSPLVDTITTEYFISLAARKWNTRPIEAILRGEIDRLTGLLHAANVRKDALEDRIAEMEAK